MKIAVCIDETEPSKKALKKAVEFADLTSTDLVLIHNVSEEIMTSNDELVQEGSQKAMKRGEEFLSRKMKEAEDLSINDDVSIHTELIVSDGSAVDSIIDYIKDSGIEQTFIGHRALKSRHEELFGSFAKKMISETTVPVTVVTMNGD